MKLQQLAILVGIIGIILGYNTGREYGEFNFIADNLLVLSLLHIIVAILINTWQMSTNISLAYINSTLGGMLVIYILGNIGLPYSPMASVSLFTGMQDQYIQEVYRLGLYSFYIIMPLITILVAFVPEYYNIKLYSESMARFHIVASTIVLPLAAGAWLSGTVAPQALQNLGIFAAISFYLAVFSGALNIYFTITKNSQKFKSDSMAELLKYGSVIIMMIAAIRAVASLGFIQNLISYTWFNTRDLSLDAQSYALLLMIGAINYVLQNTVNHTFGKRSIRIMLIMGTLGLAFMLTANITQGFYQGALSGRSTDTGELAINNWSNIMVAGSWFHAEIKDAGNLLSAWLMSLRSIFLLGNLILILAFLFPIVTMLLNLIRQGQDGYQKPNLVQ